MLEHRCIKRVKTNKWIRLGTDRIHSVDGIVNDMNRYGVFVESAAELPRNLGVKLELDVNVKPLPMLVVHLSRNGVGMVIDMQDFDAVERLSQSFGRCNDDCIGGGNGKPRTQLWSAKSAATT